MNDSKRDAHSGSPPSPRSGSLSAMNAPLSTPPRSPSSSLSAMQPPAAIAHQGQPQAADHASSPVLSPMRPQLPPPAAHIAINVPVQNGQQAQAQPAAAPSAWTTGAKVLSHGADVAAAAVSLSDAFSAQVPYVRSMASGATWATSAALSPVGNRGQNTRVTAASDTMNGLAGVASMVATGLHPDHADAGARVAYASNALWVGAGLATAYTGAKTFSSAKGWDWQALSGGLQVASGLANAAAGAAGMASTYLSGQNSSDPRAMAASVFSGAAWVAGSVLGAASSLAAPRTPSNADGAQQPLLPR